MNKFEGVISDRGSKYAVSGGPADSRAAVQDFLKTLKRGKKYAKATHNTWAVVLSDGGPLKNDDGEGGAGQLILQMLEREGLTDHVVVVTRWYGGKHLGGDRFRHVQDCVLTVSGQSDFELPLLGVGLSKRFWKLKMPSELKTNLYMIPSNERFFSNHVLRAYSLPPYKLFS